MPTYTNPTNIFNFIPNDVLTYVINPFLSGEDRFNFNAVLEPTERLAKKFPTDFAIHHSIRTFAPVQRKLSLALHRALDIFDKILYDRENFKIIDSERIDNALVALRRYCGFLNSVQATILMEYRANAKESALRDVEYFLSEECPAHSFIKPKFRRAIEKVLQKVQDTDFLRHVVVPKSFSGFLTN